MWRDESEAVAPIIWLYQTVDDQKEEVFFPDLLITLRRHDHLQNEYVPHKIYYSNEFLQNLLKYLTYKTNAVYCFVASKLKALWN